MSEKFPFIIGICMELPGSPVVRTWGSHSWGPGSQIQSLVRELRFLPEKDTV